MTDIVGTILSLASSGYELAHVKHYEETCFLLQQPSINSLKEQVWKVATTNKIHHFLWQTFYGALAVNGRFAYRHVRVDPCCPRCGHLEETINYALFTCPSALQCWVLSNISASPNSFPYENLFENVDYLFRRLQGQ